jgi:hypothetical protein
MEVRVATKVVHLNLRLPPDLHERLGEWARAEHRSLHSQVLHVLTEALERESKRMARRSKSTPAE